MKPSPPHAEAPAWIEAAAEEALIHMVRPGTEPSAAPSAEDIAAMRSFFLSNHQYEDREARSQLWLQLCRFGELEATDGCLVSPPPRTSVPVTNDRSDWVVFATHNSGHCVSDDWGWYSAEAKQTAERHGAVTVHAGPDNDVVVVMSSGIEVARIPVSGHEVIIARAGSKPPSIAYNPSTIEADIAADLAAER